MKRFLLGLLITFLVMPQMACIENNITAPAPEAISAKVQLPPFVFPTNSVPLGFSFTQPPLTFYAPAGWDGQMTVEVKTIAAEKDNVATAYVVLNPLEDTSAPSGMKGWALYVTATAVGYGQARITVYPTANPAGAASYLFSGSAKG